MEALNHLLCTIIDPELVVGPRTFLRRLHAILPSFVVLEDVGALQSLIQHKAIGLTEFTANDCFGNVLTLFESLLVRLQTLLKVVRKQVFGTRHLVQNRPVVIEKAHVVTAKQ